jgi:hypothetical protein
MSKLITVTYILNYLGASEFEDLRIVFSFLVEDKRFFSFPMDPGRLGGLSDLPIQGYRGALHGSKA